jgi:propionyl-CoA carboxylase beta chain
MTYSGTCDVIGDDDAQTIAKARELLDYLPNNCRETPPEIPSADDPDRKVEELAQIIPDEIEIKYDMRDVIQVLADEGKYFEIKNEYATQLITCFCRFNGRVVGLVAQFLRQVLPILAGPRCLQYPAGHLD